MGRPSVSQPARQPLATRIACVSAIAAAIAFGAGCASGDPDTNSSEKPAKTPDATSVAAALPPNVVTDKALDAADDDSPERALLTWWQAFQFRDTELVDALTDPVAAKAVGSARLTALVRRVGPTLQGIRVLKLRRAGNVASVRAALLTFTPKQGETTPPKEPTSLTPASFAMRMRDGEWRFADSAYLRGLARAQGL